MSEVRPLLVGLLAASALAFSPASQAQMSGQNMYAGVGFGQTTASGACDGAASVGITSCSDSDTGMRFFGGYRFNPNLAAEVGYSDLGKISASGLVLGVPTSADWKATAFDFSAVGTLPINEQFSLLGRIGVTRWSVDLDANVGGLPLSYSSSGTDLTYGVGAQYDLTNQLGVRGEWQQYSSLGDSATTGQGDVDLISASLLYKFQ